MSALASIEHMDHITFLMAVVIVTALALDFTNGFHDTRTRWPHPSPPAL